MPVVGSSCSSLWKIAGCWRQQAFTGPSLTGLISQAFHGKDTSQAAINTMLSALQTQLTSGPLADLNSGTVDGNGFITEAQSLVASYYQNVDQQLLPHFTHIDNCSSSRGRRSWPTWSR